MPVADVVIVQLQAQMAGFLAEMRRGQAEFDRRISQIEQRATRGERRVNASLSRFVRAGLFALAAREIVQYADAWTSVGRALSSTEQFFGLRVRTAEQLADIALRTRSDLVALSQLYNRTAIATRGMGLAEQQVADITETVAKALKLGGAAASEQASALLQLSQALQKGKLDGDEFRSIMENAVVIQDALIKKLGITKQELFDFAAEGKIGVRDLVEALLEIGPAVDQAFKATTSTFSEAFTNLGTSLTVLVGNFMEASGTGNALTDTINDIAGAVDDLASRRDVMKSIGDALKNLVVKGAVLLGGGGLVSDEQIEEARRRNLSGGDFSRRFGGGSGGDASLNTLKQRLNDLAGGEIRGGAAPGKAGGGGKSPEQKFADEIRRIRERTAELKLEADTVGLSAREIAKREIALKLEQEASEHGLTIDRERRQFIDELSEAYATQVDILERVRERQQEIDDAAQQSFEIVKNGFISAIVEGEKFEDVLRNVVKQLATLALNNTLTNLFAPKQGGAGGGIFGSIFGSIGKLFAGGFQGGGNIPSGKFGLVGERGPEFVRGPAMVSPSSRSEGGVTVVIHQSNDFSGVDPASIAKLDAKIGIAKNEAVREAIAGVAATRAKRPGYLKGA